MLSPFHSVLVDVAFEFKWEDMLCDMLCAAELVLMS